MALKIGRLVGNHRIADGVGLIEGIVGEVVNFIVDGLGGGFGDAICDAALDVPLRITVDEGIPLLFDLLGLFLRDGPAHHIRLSQRITA